MTKLLKYLVALWVFTFFVLSLLRKYIDPEVFHKGVLTLGFLGLILIFMGFKYNTKYFIILVPSLILLFVTVTIFSELLLLTIFSIIITAILLWIWRRRVKEIFRAE